MALVVCSMILAGGASAGGDLIKVPRTIGFSDESGASDKVKSECKLQTKVTHYLDQYSEQVELVDGKPGKKGRALELEITMVHAPGGGAWSGAKFMTVKGKLLENGKEVSNFTAKRYSGGGFMGGSKGTCSIIGRCAKAIGKDIATWLETPMPNAHLDDG